MIDRLPWFVQPVQPRCMARLDNGDACELHQHPPTIAHAAQRGELTVRWSVLTWGDRSLDHIESVVQPTPTD